MKIEHLQKIIDRIQNQIHCPKCKARFLREDIEINSVKGNQVEFSSGCRVCAAKAHISAEIGATSPSAPKLEPGQSFSLELGKRSLHNQDLENIKNAVNDFKGHSVEDLFK